MLAIPHQKTRDAHDEESSRSKTVKLFPPARSTEPGVAPYSEETSNPSWETLAMGCQYRLPDLARVCHVSMRTLQRHFRKHYNKTLSEWVRELRLDRARSLLTTAESVKYVAFELGYKQPSHFTRDFKDRFGVPPSTLRWPLMKIRIAPDQNRLQ